MFFWSNANYIWYCRKNVVVFCYCCKVISCVAPTLNNVYYWLVLWKLKIPLAFLNTKVLQKQLEFWVTQRCAIHCTHCSFLKRNRNNQLKSKCSHCFLMVPFSTVFSVTYVCKEQSDFIPLHISFVFIVKKIYYENIKVYFFVTNWRIPTAKWI